MTRSTNPYPLPVDAYLAMAHQREGEEKSNLFLVAAGRAVEDGQLQQAVFLISQLEDLNTLQEDKKNILLAKIALMQDKPKLALSELGKVREKNNLPAFFQLQYHEGLANVYEDTAKPAYALLERMTLEKLYLDEHAQKNNRRMIWLDLTKIPTAELQTMALENSNDSSLKGWLELALLNKENFTTNQLLSKIENWQNQYAVHPANSLLGPKKKWQASYFKTPQQVALILPLSGSLAGPGQAIKDGFLAAKDADGTHNELQVKIYDSAANDIEKIYQQAVDDGAEFIVGPLTKTEVAKVAALDHPVPTLFLNDVDNENIANAFQFGLSPSNEARQIAVKASKHGLKRALVIAPAGIWGDEITKAFQDQWLSAGGQVIDSLRYDPATDLNKSVRELLGVSEKKALEKQYKAGSEEDLAAGPKRRQDFDMIFLLAYPTKARQIMPLLKYYFAGDIPVYATSNVYAGNNNIMRDRDLDGIIFCDIPWIFKHQLVNKNWPEQFNSYSRLYAIGLDSYDLGKQLNKLLIFPASGLNEKNGVLYITNAQQIAHILAWGQFRGGVAQMASETL